MQFLLTWLPLNTRARFSFVSMSVRSFGIPRLRYPARPFSPRGILWPLSGDRDAAADTADITIREAIETELVYSRGYAICYLLGRLPPQQVVRCNSRIVRTIVANAHQTTYQVCRADHSRVTLSGMRAREQTQHTLRYLMVNQRGFIEAIDLNIRRSRGHHA